MCEEICAYVNVRVIFVERITWKASSPYTIPLHTLAHTNTHTHTQTHTHKRTHKLSHIKCHFLKLIATCLLLSVLQRKRMLWRTILRFLPHILLPISYVLGSPIYFLSLTFAPFTSNSPPHFIAEYITLKIKLLNVMLGKLSEMILYILFHH